VLDLVPSLLRAVIAALRTLPPDERAAAIPDRLRLVLTAGERLTAELVEAWWSLAGTGARVINLYGASEVGGSVAWHEVTAADRASISLRASIPRATTAAPPAQPSGSPPPTISLRSSIPIGRARSGTTIELLDPSLAPVANGAIGEVCIAGPAVARGYVGPEPSDRARFVDLTREAPPTISLRGARDGFAPAIWPAEATTVCWSSSDGSTRR